MVVAATTAPIRLASPSSNLSGSAVTAYSPFVSLRPKSRWGGVELAARYSALDLTDDDVIGGKERNVTAGINWYLTRFVRLMFNYVWVDAQRRGDLRTDRPQIFQLRMQLAI